MSNSPIVVWNETVVSLVQRIADSDPARDRNWRSTGPAARLYAILNVAMHDALAGIDSAGPLRQRWVTSVPDPKIPAQFSVFAALGAGYHLLDSLFENQDRKNELVATRDKVGKSLPNFSAEPARRAALYGQEVAKALLDDARWGRIATNPTEDPPEYQRPPRTPESVGNLGFSNAGAAYRKLKPFILDRGDRFHAPPPPELTSFEYGRDWHEVYAVGRRATRVEVPNSFESRMARLWSGGRGTSQESGYWMEIARMVLVDRGVSSLSQQALAMTAVAVANCDAMISSWSSKYTFTYWRPMAAIRRGDEDGNPATFSDPTWEPYNGIPGAPSQGESPEHTSGTASFAGACSVVLAKLFGERVSFKVDFQKARPDREVGPETFQSFGIAADIAANSRIWNGIHFRFAGERGLIAGRRTGQQVIREMGLEQIS
jgi:hypothetical protein